MVVTACSHVLLKERRHRLEDEVEVVVREVIEVHADLQPRLGTAARHRAAMASSTRGFSLLHQRFQHTRACIHHI
jgi:hypothetical protein